MGKYFRILFLSLIVAGLMAGSAFAAASLNGGNATVAAELISGTVATNLPVTAANTAYQPAGAVAVSSQLKISLTGGSYSTSGALGMNICQGTTSMGSGTATTAGDTTVTITLIKPLASGTVYTIQSDSCAVANAPLGAQIRINAGAVGGSTVVMTVDNALSPGDANIFATATIATVANQLSATLISAATDVIDFSASPTMTKFKTAGSGTTTTSVAKIVLQSDETLGTKVATGLASNTACGAWPATGEALTFTVTPGSGTAMGSGFHATSAYQVSGNIVKAAIAATDTSAAGDAILQATLAANSCGALASSTLLGTAANQLTNTLTVDSSTALTARSYKLAVATKVSGAIIAAARTILADTTAWTWTLDATQYYLPLIKTSAGTETYIKLQSKSSLAASNGVNVQVLASDGTMVSITPTVASITSGTPYTLTGADLEAAVIAAGKTVSGTAGFAAIITVNTPNADVFGYANIVSSAGEKRVPLQRLTSVNAGAAWSTIAE